MAPTIASISDTEKWETGINITTTDIKEIKAFIDQRLSIYKENRWKEFDLQESFIDDFETFTRDIFDELGKDRLKRIRNYLRENNIYIKKEVKKLIIDGLLEIIYESTPLKQPTNNLSPNNPPPNNPPLNNTSYNKFITRIPIQITEAIDKLTLQESFGRKITYLTRFYINKIKYSGEQDNFDFKFKIF